MSGINKYRVKLDVRSVYTIPIYAASAEEAESIALSIWDKSPKTTIEIAYLDSQDPEVSAELDDDQD